MPSALIPNGSGKRDARSWVSNPYLGAMTWLSLRRRLKYLPMSMAYTLLAARDCPVKRRSRVSALETLQVAESPYAKVVKNRGTLTTVFGFFNMRQGGSPWHDNRLRQAVHLTMNREDLIRYAAKGNEANGGCHGYPSLPLTSRYPKAARRWRQAGNTSGFFTYNGGSPRSTRSTFSAAAGGRAAISSREWPIMCGVRITLSSVRKGLSSASGSASNTSRAAPAITPSRNTRESACSSMAPPRAVLTR